MQFGPSEWYRHGTILFIHSTNIYRLPTWTRNYPGPEESMVINAHIYELYSLKEKEDKEIESHSTVKLVLKQSSMKARGSLTVKGSRNR